MDLFAKRSRTTKQLSLTLFPDLESSSSSSSIYAADAVASNEDLLTEILLHLPIRSLVYFKSVSKHWLSLITNPRFSLLRNPLPLPASALFLCARRKPEYEFVPLDNDNCNSGPPFKTLNFVHDPLGIRIIQSCNGLLFCSSCRGHKSKHKYYIYNPTTKQFTVLPQLGGGGVSRYVCGMSLAFDPSKSPHYKVVCVRRSEMHRDHFQIEIYSSESGPWRVSGQPFFAHFYANFLSGVYWNGSIHWINLLAGNSNSLYFNVDDERLEKMPTHPVSHVYLDEIQDMAIVKDSYFGESDDHLHLIEVYVYMAVLYIYEMERDYSGWFVKYKVNLGAISYVFPEMIQCQHELTGENDYAVAVKSLVRREKEDGDASFLVLEIPGKVIRYTLMSNSVEKLCEFAPADTKFSSLSFGGCSESFQYIESLACV